MPDRVPKPKSLATLYRSLIASTALAAVMVAAVFWLNARSDSEDEWVRHSLEVHGQLAELMLEVQRAENSQRGYLLTGRNSDLQSYTTAADQIPAMLNRIGTLISDDPKQVEVLAQLSPLIAGTLKELQTGIEVRGGKDVKLTLPVADADASHQPMQQIAALSRAMQAEEERLLTGRRADATAASRQLQIGVAAAFLLICGIGGLIGFYTRRSFGELAAASLRLVRANEELLDQVSRRVQVESQLRQSQKMEAIGQLTGGIAHDFNNMLGVVLGSLELMQRRIKRGDFNIERFMDAARTATERASSLTHRLLAFARQQPLAPQPLDANRMIASMADLLRSTLGEQIRIENVAAAGLWATNADPHQLENTILNIALNARDAMPEGGKLTIETGNSFLDDNYCKQNPEVEPGQYVLVAISDTGAGMPPEVAAQAFDPFYTTKPTGKGTGLGLSQVYGFIKQSRGHVKIYSEPGAGTTVKIYLPRLVNAEAPAERWAPRRSEMGQASEVILVVEDDPLMRQTTADTLRDLGYTVLDSDGAKGALAILDETPEIKLLFTDVVMPEVNGKRLADEAQRRQPGLKVLFTTGYTRNAVVHGGVLDAGVNFLTKPFTSEELAGKVRSLLDS